MSWFEDVLVLLEERNMTRAAARRNITQPAFSRRIRSFEDWLGVRVLDRQANRIDISPALAQNESEIRALMSRLRELRTKIAQFDPKGSTIAVAAQHAAIQSTFPDMSLRARSAFPGLRFRLRAANLGDCVAMFVRGDTSLLLCYEAKGTPAMPFGADVQRGVWGQDALIPVAGGALRDTLRDGADIPDDTPALTYPDASFFGTLLGARKRRFGTSGQSTSPICQTAFSGGIRDMALRGLGVGWVPLSMARDDIESGALISLADALGRETLDVVIYGDRKIPAATELVALWSRPD
ncbi:MAG: LysR substrate-binding domain-containing protein [Marinibacterium sp.]|nr:LysR substrate-binding domain-containing protein [Marinibacterium sp.]